MREWGRRRRPGCRSSWGWTGTWRPRRRPGTAWGAPRSAGSSSQPPEPPTSRVGPGILKREVSLYHWPPVWLVWNQLYDNWQFLFLIPNRLIQFQTSQTGGQQYSDTSPFSIPWLMWIIQGKSFDLGSDKGWGYTWNLTNLLRVSVP